MNSFKDMSKRYFRAVPNKYFCWENSLENCLIEFLNCKINFKIMVVIAEISLICNNGRVYLFFVKVLDTLECSSQAFYRIAVVNILKKCPKKDLLLSCFVLHRTS